MGLGVGILLLMIGTAIVLRERKYEGKTAREWIYLLDPHVNFRAQHDAAAEVVARIGAEAVPVIRDILREPRSRPIERLRILAQRFRVLPPDTVRMADRQYRASRAAYLIAERSEVDISVLVPLLSYHLTNSNYADVENGRALASAGPRGVAVLTNLASHPNRRWRDRAIVSLQHARSAPGVFETYLRTVNDEDENIRFFALSSLGRYPKADREVIVPLALGRMESTNRIDRWAAATVLSAFVEDARARAGLTNALRDEDATVRSTAESGLKAAERVTRVQ